MSMLETIEIMNKINDIHLGQDLDKEKFVEFIMNCDNDMYSGKNEDGEEIVVATQRFTGIKVSTYQKNGWIRVNDYTLSIDENGIDVIMSETFEGKVR